MAITFDKANVLATIEELKQLVEQPDTDDDSYIRLTVRDGVRNVFDALGDREALRHMRALRGV